MAVPIARPTLGPEEAEAVQEVLESGMIAAGKRVADFEDRFAACCGVTHAVAVNSGTAALHAALLAAGIGPGDEVIVPSFSFIATATAVSMCGARPVFADVEPERYTIDPASAAALVTERTKAVIGVHLYGQVCDAPAIANLCADSDLIFIEDAAQAHGASLDGRRAGSIGDLGCFSFYATKNITTGEGGMVTTADDDYAARLRRIINHGQSEKYLHTELGYNYRMTDIAAAIGLVQLDRLDGFNRRRQETAAYYSSGIDSPWLHTPSTAPGAGHVFHQYVLRVEDSAPLERDGLMAHLRLKGIGTAVHYPVPIHRQPLYIGHTASCPVADALAASVFSIPVHPTVTDEDRTLIVDTLNEVA
ncbi:DegT/DnrJ/EryC1/StrS family aminotransferase [Methanofollis fontis]|uniref:Aminotransferase DegT n=1 Tax=Methanofollis fontis TaxID=2052832 RepID=A0A483CVH5_9EURY|nr:DegT/DnrJ/EryC1/StrS family aminotransferase [Methanofollis fontis]TAJ45656.1 aminotransferase DegT [Methanofollis fontis]